MIENLMTRKLIIILLFINAFLVQCTPKVKNNESVSVFHTDFYGLTDCSGTGDIEAFGIIGGSPLSPQSRLSKNIVKIRVTHYEIATNSDLATYVCTGSLIDTNIVLTAAHCFDSHTFEGLDEGEVSYRVQVLSGARSYCPSEKDKTSFVVSGEKVIINENYKPSGKIGDIALVKLSDPMPGSPIFYPLDSETHDFGPNEKLVVSGYGNTQGYRIDEENEVPLKLGFVQSNKFPGFKEKFMLFYEDLVQKTYDKNLNSFLAATKKLNEDSGYSFTPKVEAYAKKVLIEKSREAVQKITPKFDYSSKNELLLFDQSGEDGICAGDSGSAGFRVQGESLRIVGVAQAVFTLDKKTDSCHYSSYFTNVSFYKEWIIKAFDALKDNGTLKNQKGENLFR